MASAARQTATGVPGAGAGPRCDQRGRVTSFLAMRHRSRRPQANAMDTRTILITGCSSGIGRCVARGLAARGYRVFATARRREDVERLQAEGFASLRLDLADSGSIAAAVEEVLARTDGRLYALFNNGAYGQPGAVEDLSRETLRLQFETNLFGWHELTNRVLPVMR